MLKIGTHRVALFFIQLIIIKNMDMLFFQQGEQFTSPVFFFQAEDGIRAATVTGVQTCALPISPAAFFAASTPMLRIRAWACGLRTTARWTTPWCGRSSVYRPWPVISRGSSRRWILAPTSWETAIYSPPIVTAGRAAGLVCAPPMVAAADFTDLTIFT